MAQKKNDEPERIFISGNKPLDPNRWDAGTRAIYERIMAGHGLDF